MLGASLSIAFVVLTQEAVAEVEPDERGLASGIFETADHLFGGAVGVALYASVLTATSTTASDADGYRAAFLGRDGSCPARTRRRIAGTGPSGALPLTPSTLIADAGESHSEDPLRNAAAAEHRHTALRGKARAVRAVR